MPDPLIEYVYPSFASVHIQGANGVYLIADILDLILSNGEQMQVKLTRTYARGTDKISMTQTVETTDDLSLDVSVAAGATNQLVPCSFDHDALKVLFIMSTVDMTLKTNSSSSPIDTFTLKANIPQMWAQDSGVANPLSADITALYVTNPGIDAGTLQVRLSV